MQILKTLVGSQAHGLATPKSDNDYRGVFLLPTSTIVSFNYKPHNINWIEGREDDTSYELGHFLSLATQCNPTILEVFKAPVIEAEPVGWELRALFSKVWTAKRVADAFGGYSLNQRKKFLEDKDDHRWKFGVAYVRTLLQGSELLLTGDFNVKIQDNYQDHDGLFMDPYQSRDEIVSWPHYLQDVRHGHVRMGDVVDTAEYLRDRLDKLASAGPYKDQVADLDRVNDFLVMVRKDYWEETDAKERQDGPQAG